MRSISRNFLSIVFSGIMICVLTSAGYAQMLQGQPPSEVPDDACIEIADVVVSNSEDQSSLNYALSVTWGGNLLLMDWYLEDEPTIDEIKAALDSVFEVHSRALYLFGQDPDRAVTIIFPSLCPPPDTAFSEDGIGGLVSRESAAKRSGDPLYKFLMNPPSGSTSTGAAGFPMFDELEGSIFKEDEESDGYLEWSTRIRITDSISITTNDFTDFVDSDFPFISVEFAFGQH